MTIMVLCHIFYSQLRKYVASKDYRSPHLSVNCGDIVTTPTTTALDYLGSKSKVYIVFIDIWLILYVTRVFFYNMYYNYQPYGEMVLPTSFTKITWWSKLISQWATRECFILHCIVQPQTIFCKPRRISVPQDCQDHLLGIFLCLQRAKTFHQIRITSLYNFLCAFMINKELWHFIHNNMKTNDSGITI